MDRYIRHRWNGCCHPRYYPEHYSGRGNRWREDPPPAWSTADEIRMLEEQEMNLKDELKALHSRLKDLRSVDRDDMEGD